MSTRLGFSKLARGGLLGVVNSNYCKWLSCVIALALGWLGSAMSAQDLDGDCYRYKYVSLTGVKVPPGFDQFVPTVIDDRGRIYGDVYEQSGIAHVAIYEHGVLTVLKPGNAVTANAIGTIGGFVSDYPQSDDLQAALFRRSRVELIPPLLPGETRSLVQSVNDSDTALVWSEDPSGFNRNTYRLVTIQCPRTM